MSINRILAVFAIAGPLLLVPCMGGAHASAVWSSHLETLSAQDSVKGKLATVKSIKCTFPIVAVGTWGGKQPEANVKPVNFALRFDSINADEGTAQLDSSYGAYDIIVRYAEGYLHFIQAFLNGPMYTTTVLEKQTSGGKLKAMHSRHEYTDFALPGYTSSPEQYYGECEILK